MNLRIEQVWPLYFSNQWRASRVFPSLNKLSHIFAQKFTTGLTSNTQLGLEALNVF